MTSSVWTAAETLAHALAETPTFRAFHAGLATTSSQDDLGSRLNNFTGVYSPLRIYPVLLGVRLNMMSETAAVLSNKSDEAWLRAAVESGTAFQVVIEGIRAGLPSYPVLGLPHLRAGSPHYLNDPFFVRGFPWDHELLRVGLQRLPLPPDLRPLGGEDMIELQRVLHRAIRGRDSWQAFCDAQEALTGEDRAALRGMGDEFSTLASPDGIEQQAGPHLLAQFNCREAILDECMQRSTGGIRAYLEAFEAIDLLLTMVASFMGTIITSGEVPVVEPRRLALGGGAIRDVDFVVQGDHPMMNPSEVLWMKTPEGGASGVVYPTAISHMWGSLNDPDSSRMVITGKLTS